jgi:hypothetical protein
VTLTARTIKTNSLTAAGTSGAATDALGSSATLLLALGSQGALAVISGTFTATLQFEAQGSGGTWFAAPAVPIGTTGGALTNSATAAGNFLILAAGALQARVRCSAYTSGTAVVELSNAPVGGFNAPITGPATGTAAQQVQGTAADGAAAAGNPVQFGGVDGGGLAQALLMDTSGRPVTVGGVAVAAAGLTSNPFTIAGLDGSNLVRVASVLTPADGIGNTNQFLWASAAGLDFNDTSWDRRRNNVQSTLLASAARVGTAATADQTNYNAKGVIVFINVTVNPGGGETLTFQLQVKDPVGAGYVTVATSGAIAVFGAAAGATGLEVLDLFPGAAETAALAGWTTQALHLSRTWRVNVLHSAASSWTYSVAASIAV